LLGAFLATCDGPLATLGFLALMQGIGLIVAIVPLALGHNPLDRE
jgi:hypothetical protein